MTRKINPFPNEVQTICERLESHPNISAYGIRVRSVYRNIRELENIAITQLSVGYSTSELEVVRNLVLDEHSRLCRRLYRMLTMWVYHADSYSHSLFDDFYVFLY